MLLLLALGTSSAHARTYFVYDGGVALGRRFGVTKVSSAIDLTYSPLDPASTRIAAALSKLRRGVAYRCHLIGHVVFLGVEARTATMRSRFRVHYFGGCRTIPLRAMLVAHGVRRG